MRVFKMKIELILHGTYIVDSVTLCSGGGKVGSWGSVVLVRCCGIAKQEGHCGYFVKRELKDLFFQEQNMAVMKG